MVKLLLPKTKINEQTLNITDESNLQEVSYIDNNDRNPKHKKLCSELKNKKCTVKKSFKKGEHDVDVRIIDKAGNSFEKELGVFGVI